MRRHVSQPSIQRVRPLNVEILEDRTPVSESFGTLLTVAALAGAAEAWASRTAALQVSEADTGGTMVREAGHRDWDLPNGLTATERLAVFNDVVSSDSHEQAARDAFFTGLQEEDGAKVGGGPGGGATFAMPASAGNDNLVSQATRGAGDAFPSSSTFPLPAERTADDAILWHAVNSFAAAPVQRAVNSGSVYRDPAGLVEFTVSLAVLAPFPEELARWAFDYWIDPSEHLRQYLWAHRSDGTVPSFTCSSRS